MLKKPDLNKPVFRLFPQKAKLVEQGRCVICTKKIKEEDFKVVWQGNHIHIQVWFVTAFFCKEWLGDIM